MRTWNSPDLPSLPGRLSKLEVFDTASAQLQDMLRATTARLYVCGITPYDSTHLGHAATYLTFDLLHRAWRDAGVEVGYVQNATDIDDPLLERAERDHEDWEELAARQIARFQADMEALRVLPPTYYQGAVESIPWVVEAVTELLAEGTAYRHDSGDIYFDTQAASHVSQEPRASQSEPAVAQGWQPGALGHLNFQEMLILSAERGGDPERSGKRNPLDPLLWRVKRAGEPAWPGDSLGEGRPGWHIECTAIARKLLPAPLTVQGGGSDLVFPHHDMGDGHAWASGGEPLAEYFVHTGMVGLDGEKMSKSRGNLVFVSELRAEMDPMAIRTALLNHHYRQDWFWNDAQLEQARVRIDRWQEALMQTPQGSAEPLIRKLREALGQDLDSPQALAAVDAWAQEALAKAESPGSQTSEEDARLITAALDALLGVTLH